MFHHVLFAYLCLLWKRLKNTTWFVVLQLYLQSKYKMLGIFFFVSLYLHNKSGYFFSLSHMYIVHYVGTVLNSLRFAIDEAVGCGNCVCYKFQSRNLWYICCFLSPACNHFPATKWTLSTSNKDDDEFTWLDPYYVLT